MGDPSVDLLPEKGEKHPLIEMLDSTGNRRDDLQFVKRFLEAVEKKHGEEAEARILNKPSKFGRTPLMASTNSDGNETLKVCKKTGFFYVNIFVNFLHSFFSKKNAIRLSKMKMGKLSYPTQSKRVILEVLFPFWIS